MLFNIETWILTVRNKQGVKVRTKGKGGNVTLRKMKYQEGENHIREA
jgi:hypothetical protein